MNELKYLLEAPILNKCVNYFCPWLYLLKYLQENNLQYELQSAFHSGHSTEMALIRITD